MRTVRVAVEGTGGRVEVDGVDISNSVTRVTLDAPAHKIPHFVIEVAADADISAVGEVTFVRADELAAFFAAVDPDALEEEALARLDGFGATNATAAILEVLADMAGGTWPNSH